MGATYIISKREFSEKAQKIYGNGWVWSTKVVVRQRPPSDERSFHIWLWSLVREQGGPGEYKIVRSQAKGEKRGWHPVWLGYVDNIYLRIDRKYTELKGVPSLPPSRDLWYKKPQERTRFSKTRRRFG